MVKQGSDEHHRMLSFERLLLEMKRTSLRSEIFLASTNRHCLLWPEAEIVTALLTKAEDFGLAGFE